MLLRACGNGGLTVRLFRVFLHPPLSAGSSSGTGPTSSEPLTQLCDSRYVVSTDKAGMSQFTGLPWKNTCKCRHITDVFAHSSSV